MAAVPLSASLPDCQKPGGSTIQNHEKKHEKGRFNQEKPWYMIEYYSLFSSVLGFCHEIHRVQDENFITTSVTSTT